MLRCNVEMHALITHATAEERKAEEQKAEKARATTAEPSTAGGSTEPSHSHSQPSAGGRARCEALRLEWRVPPDVEETREQVAAEDSLDLPVISL